MTKPQKNVPAHAVASRRIASPVGPLVLYASDKGLAGLFFGHRVPIDAKRPRDQKENLHLNQATTQLGEYFSGTREQFDLTLDPKGTDFQESVWLALREIPYGQTLHYGGIAESIGNPKSVRAVGGANGANPISIIVPCHRVIGADGSMTGFGGGLDIKRNLLVHEGIILI